MLVSSITAVICIRGGAVFFPVILAEAALLIPREQVTWKAKIIGGTIKLFIGVFGTWVGILMQNCGPGIIDALGITSDTSVVDDMTNCAISIGTTVAIAWGGLVLASDGTNAGWVYNSNSGVAHKQSSDYARHRGQAVMFELVNGLHINVTGQHSGPTLDTLS